jgi:hypothetical protein
VGEGAPLRAASPLALERRVRALGAGFFLLFFCYISLQQLQSSLNGDLGYYSNLIAYVCFAASSLCAPFFVARARSLGLLLSISATAYLWNAAMNIPDPVIEGPYLASSAAVGLLAGTLWVGQATYVARAAAAAALAAPAGGAVTDAASRLNGVFFFVFQGSGCVGGSFSALLLLFAGPGARSLLFAVLSGAGLAAVLLLCCLVEPDAPGETFLALPRCGAARGAAAAAAGAAGAAAPTAAAAPAAAAQSPAAFFRFLCASRRLQMVLPLLFAMGAFQAVGFSTLTAAMVAPALGVSFVSWAGVVYFGSAALVMFPAPWLAQTPAIGRRWVLAAAGALWVGCIGGMLTWISAWPSTGSAAPPPRHVALPVLFSFAVALGCGDGVFFSMVSATLQNWFPADATFAFAALRSGAALGTAVFCGIGPTVSAGAQFVALIAIFAAAAAVFACVHVFDVSIDSRAEGAEAPADAAKLRAAAA